MQASERASKQVYFQTYIYSTYMHTSIYLMTAEQSQSEHFCSFLFYECL